jgi:hypothetical protein
MRRWFSSILLTILVTGIMWALVYITPNDVITLASQEILKVVIALDAAIFGIAMTIYGIVKSLGNKTVKGKEEEIHVYLRPSITLWIGHILLCIFTLFWSYAVPTKTFYTYLMTVLLSAMFTMSVVFTIKLLELTLDFDVIPKGKRKAS